MKKLRNKKTGEIAKNVSSFDTRDFKIGIEYEDSLGYSSRVAYDSLAELNEEWEDYTPNEPLIKDEKIRKAVKVWADASGIEKVTSYGAYLWIGFVSENTVSDWKFECNYKDASEFKHGKEYTIAELCGEEENEE